MMMSTVRSTSPVPAVARRGQLAGREPECARIAQAVDGLARGTGQVIEISGEPGIGKTRMLGELADLARDRGLTVLIGRARPGATEVAFAALVEAIDGRLGRLPEAVIAGIRADHRGVLAAVFPSFPFIPEIVPQSVGSTENHRRMVAVRALLEALAADRPLVIGIDDLHWADEATVDLVRHLVAAPPTGPVLLAFAHRLRQTPARLRAAFGAAERVTRLALEPLTESEARDLVTRGRPGPLLRALYRRADGNPFYLLALAEAGPDDPAGLGELDLDLDPDVVPASAVGALAVELDALSPAARTTAQAAAVAGDPVEPALLAAVVQLPIHQLYPAIDELADHDLVRPVAGTGCFAFRHPIVRHAVYQSAELGWRLGAHARALRALRERCGDPVRLAPHLVRIAVLGDEDAIDVIDEAARAVARQSPKIAVQWLRAALALAPTERSANRRLRLRIRLGQMLEAVGRPAEAREMYRETLGEISDDATPQRAELVIGCARTERQVRRAECARVLLVEEVERLADRASVAGVTLILELAGGELADGRLGEAHDLVAEALTTARHRDDPAGTRAGLALQALIGTLSGRTAAATEAVGDAAVLDAPPGGLPLHLDTWLYLGLSELALDRPREAVHRLDRVVGRWQRDRSHPVVSHAFTAKVIALKSMGRLAEAALAAGEAVEVASARADEDLYERAQTMRTWIACCAGEHSGEPAPVALGRGRRTTGVWLDNLTVGMLAEIRMAHGDPFACLALLATAGGPDLPDVDPWSRVAWYEMLTRAAVAVARVDEADDWARRADRLARRLRRSSRTGLAALAGAQALVGRNPAAGARLALAAADQLCEVRHFVDAARARAVAGSALVAGGDVGAGRAEMRAAEAMFRACGIRRPPDGVAVGAGPEPLRPAGTRAPSSRRAKQPGLTTLTRRERQVASLVVDGLTNRQIAARLFVTEKTVEMHLSNIFPKLGVTNRAGVAREYRDGAEAR